MRRPSRVATPFREADGARAQVRGRDRWPVAVAPHTSRVVEQPNVNARANHFGLPNLGIGVGLRSTHYRHLLDEHPAQ